MADSGAHTAASALADFVPRLARIIATALQSDPEVSLTLRQYRILERLTQRPHRTTELASTSEVTQPTATSVITALETRGLVSRTPDPDDGRATLIQLTSAGAEIFEQAHETVINRLTKLTAHLTPELADTLHTLSMELAEGMDRIKKERGSGNTTA